MVAEHRADAVLAGAGVANLAAWVAVARARAAGDPVQLTAELGLWGYTPTPADPYIFNHRVFPRTTLLADASTVLGMVVGGPGTTTVGCLGAAEVDQDGNLNSTRLGDGRVLVGSGGANDVVSRATACVVVTLGRPRRLPGRVAYITAPGLAGHQRGHRPGGAPTPRGTVTGGGGPLRARTVRPEGAGDGGLLRVGARGGGRRERAGAGDVGRGRRPPQFRPDPPVPGVSETPGSVQRRGENACTML